MIFVKKLLKKIDLFLNLLLVFLIPSQLAYHFWPSFSFIFGIRIDYLAPTVYFTDVFFILVFVVWLIKDNLKIFRKIKVSTFYYIVLAFLIINITFSISPVTTFIKWLKIGELVLFGFYITKRKNIFFAERIIKVFLFSTPFYCLLGLAQFIKGSTINGLFYWLGERSFSVFTPGIALVNIIGKNFLRIYSTFSHPNSFAGYLGLVLIFIFLSKIKVKPRLFYISIVIITATFILTFSLSACIGLLLVLIFYFMKKRLLKPKVLYIYVLITILVSLTLAMFSEMALKNTYNLPQSFRERIELANISGNVISNNWIIGTGLNTSILKGLSISKTNGIWILQPVHNIYLLLISEAGFFGIVLFYLLLSKAINKLCLKRKTWKLLLLIFVLTTGLFDHYWITSQQNLLLLTLLFSLSA